MRATIVFGLGLAISLTAGTAQAQDAGLTGQGIAGKLVGTYKLVSGNNGGKDIPKDHLDGKVRIAKDVMTTYDERGGYPHPHHLKCPEVSVVVWALGP